MKIVRRLAFVALLVGYFLWPYQAVKSFARAIQAKDAAALEGMVDFDDLRESLKDMALEAAIAQAEASLPAGSKVNREQLRQQFAKVRDSALISKQLDAVLTPQALTRMLTMTGGKDAGGGDADAAWGDQKWINPITISVQEPRGNARAIFKFKGLGWKLAGIEVPANEMRRFMAVR